jgi:hypothetical protein
MPISVLFLRVWQPESIYYIEQNANVVGVGTDIKFKIFSGKLLDVAPKSRIADSSRERVRKKCQPLYFFSIKKLFLF